MILHSFGRNFRPWSEYAKTIRTELEAQSPWPLDIIDHSLVTARFRNADLEVSFVQYLRALHAEQPPDLIVSLGAPAVAFVQRHRQQLFPTTPMVFTAVEQRRVQHSVLTANDAVVPVSNDFTAFIEHIFRLLPETKTIAVITGNSPLEQFWAEEIRNELTPFKDRTAFAWYNDLSFEEILKRAAALPPNSAIFWQLMNVDAAGVVHEGDAALKRLHAAANAPIFSYQGGFFGGEIVGGPMHSVLEVSRQTAAVAVRILRGEKASDVKTPPIGFARPIYD